MAGVPSSNGNGNGYSRGGNWAQAAIGLAGGLILGLSSAALYLGGSLRQIEVNTARLTTIEAGGSQPVVAMRGKIEALNTRLAAAEHDLHDWPATIASLRERGAEFKVRLDIIEREALEDRAAHTRETAQTVALLQRLATDEALVAGMRDRDDRIEARVTLHEQRIIDLAAQVSRTAGQTVIRTARPP